MTPSKRLKTSTGDAAPPTTPVAAHAHTKENLDPKTTHPATTEQTDNDAYPDEFDEADALEHATPRRPRSTTDPSGASRGYDAIKSFNGQAYKGMAVGGSHTWTYQPGTWRETKVEPDLWEIDFETTKERAKSAPEGSGAPVGTEYHWLIVAHQYVKKIDANTYETRLKGSKYKLTHKNASAGSWAIPTVKKQRDREVELLDDAKRRVLGLPPVTATEKVKVEKEEKGQVKLDSLFGKSPARSRKDIGEVAGKRKRDDDGSM